MAGARKKLVLFPPFQTFPTNIVSIAAGGITASSFAAGAITAAAIAANAITSAKIAAGALTTAAFAAGAIDATVLAANAVGASQFTQGAADKAWSTAARTLTAFGFTVTVGTNNDKTGYTVSTNSDKTGYSLTAGSYSIRASSSQHVTGTLADSSSSGSISVSSVTTTRTHLAGGGSGSAGSTRQLKAQLTGATTVTITSDSATSGVTNAVSLAEYF